jgi:hypothetical protein
MIDVVSARHDLRGEARRARRRREVLRCAPGGFSGLGGNAYAMNARYPWLSDPAVTNAWIADPFWVGSGSTLTTWTAAKGGIDWSGVASPTLADTWGARGFRKVTCNGTTQYMTANSLAAGVTGNDLPWSMCLAFKFETAATNKVVFAFSDTSNTLRYHILQTTTSTGTKYSIFRNDGTTTVNAIVTTPAVDTSTHVMTILFTGTAVTIRLDGVTTSVNAASHNVGSVTLTKATLGAFVGASAVSFVNASFRAMAYGTSSWSSTTYLPLESAFMLEAA